MTAFRALILWTILLAIAFGWPLAGSSASGGDKGDAQVKVLRLAAIVARLEDHIKQMEENFKDPKKQPEYQAARKQLESNTKELASLRDRLKEEESAEAKDQIKKELQSGKTPADLQAMEKELAELERQLQAKELELKQIKQKTDALRAKITAAKKVGDGKVITKVEQLLAGMPKDKYPKAGADGTPERNAANQWMKENVVGKMIEWKMWVTSVVLDNAANPGRYDVGFQLAQELEKADDKGKGSFGSGKFGPSFIWWDREMALGAETIKVRLQFTRPPVDKEAAKKGKSYFVSFLDVNEKYAKELREFKGKEVTFRGTISQAGFGAFPTGPGL